MESSILPDIRSSYSQIRAALVEANVLDLVGLLQLQRLEILQLAQIPKLDARILRCCCQVVSILGEANSCNRTCVTREVCHVGLLLEIPDLHL